MQKIGDKQFWKEKLHAAKCFHHVFYRFPSSQSVPKCVPEDVPNSTLGYIPYGLPKVQLPCIETKQVASGDAHLFLFWNWGTKEVLLLGGMPKSSKRIADGPINQYG
jgi:hypothetical protein